MTVCLQLPGLVMGSFYSSRILWIVQTLLVPETVNFWQEINKFGSMHSVKILVNLPEFLS